MDNTTSISELPLETTLPENRNLPENQINSSMNRVMDPIRVDEKQEKQVRFQVQSPDKTKTYELKDTHKVIILATIIFLLFSDVKVKSYIFNILEVIFGKFMKSPEGGSTKIGLTLYASVFGTILLLCVSFIDLSAIKLAF